MNKTELINAVAESASISKKDAKAAVEATFAEITKAMAAGDKVALIGFGTFEARQRDAKKAKNPKTGEVIDVPACKAPCFKAGSALKESVNK